MLAGGGHAHVEVLRSLAMKPVPGLRLTLISRSRTAIYSGMVPGYVAGQYSLADISVNLDRLCVLGGHRLIIGEIEGLDPVAGRFHLAGRPAIGFDSASINVGSSPDLDALPGAREHATPVKPIEGFARRFALVEQNPDAGRIALIGGGAGGVELALALSARFPERRFDLIDRHPHLLHRLPASASRWAARRLQARGVGLHLGQGVSAMTAEGPLLQDGTVLKADLSLIVTGSKAPAWIGASGLKTDDRGFMTVDAALRSVSHPAISAAGDCADYSAFPREKAGVFAVRAGPGLADNLRRTAQDQAHRALTMQRRGLQLIGDGKGAALAIWGGLTLTRPGAALFRWKDRIDRLWMTRYNSFGADMVAQMMAQPETMRCSGCGGKVGPDVLRQTLGTDVATAGDVALLSRGPAASSDDSSSTTNSNTEGGTGPVQVGSVDLLRDAFDDPYLFARIAGIHALSDLYAAGAENPKMLSALTLPFASPRVLGRDLEQVRAGLASLKVPVVGGHTAEGAELSAALTVIGDLPATAAPQALQAPQAAQAVQAVQAEQTRPPQSGDALILTKPLGIGLILAARMLAKADPDAIQATFDACEQDNSEAARQIAGEAVGLRTDVTGFGLLGHLQATLPQGLGARLVFADIPVLPGAVAAFHAGVRPSILEANQRVTAELLSHRESLDPAVSALLHDPQTSGGLLFSLPASRAQAVVSALRKAGYTEAAVIGALDPTSRIEVV